MVQPHALVEAVRPVRRPLRGALAVAVALSALVTGVLIGWPGRSTTSALAVEPLVLTVGSNGRDLRFYGDFGDGAAERVRAILATHPRIARVHLTSDGGLVDEARAVAGLIAERGLATYVPDTCVSACTLAFVAGRERYVMLGAKLGFHAPFETDDAGREIQVDGAEEARDYVAAGVSTEFVDVALRTPSTEIWYPDAKRLLGAGVVTATVDSAYFPDSTLDAGATFAAARGVVLRNVPLLAAFEAHAPAVVDEVAAWYLTGYREGRSEGDALAGLRALTARAARGALAESDDATVSAFGRLTLRALAARDGTDGCAEIGEPADAVAVDDALGETAGHGTADGVVALVTTALTARPTRNVLAALTSPMSRASLRDTDCATLQDRYAQALDTGSTLRTLLFGPGAGRTARFEASARPPSP